MFKIENKKAQAAIELAVFGAILIFILGTIVRSGVSNGFTQNDSFTAMRLAMLASWTDSKAGYTAHNSASVLFVEDRLSPDFNKYGDLDRNPYIAQGAGTFSYMLQYPWNPQTDPVMNFMPVMDVYINGQHFPFTTAAYNTTTIQRPVACPYAPNSCLENQCLRNQREWGGGIVTASQFDNIMPVATFSSTTSAALTNYGTAIFNALVSAGLLGSGTVGSTVPCPNGTGLASFVIPGFSQMPPSFSITDPTTGNPTQLNQQEIMNIQNILVGDTYQYKLFYTRVPNGTNGSPPFSPVPPSTCSGTNNALCSTMTVLDASCGVYTNANGDMQYDLSRTGYYTTTPPTCFTPGSPPCQSVEAQFPGIGTCSSISTAPDMRCFIAWQWAATPGTTEESIGLDPSSNEYPQYDIDGRLKMVTIYAISQNSSGPPTVSYEDFQGGDIDTTWDASSCGPKPGLQNDAEIYTFTQNGTYLQIKEGKLYNPETDQFVRSANKRDTIDLIQRIIQLSNNSGRFCDPSGTRLGTVANDGVTPNPVEVCISPTGASSSGSGNTCFNSEVNIKSTCYDESDNMIFVRSRLEDTRGHYWITDAQGQLQVR